MSKYILIIIFLASLVLSGCGKEEADRANPSIVKKRMLEVEKQKSNIPALIKTLKNDKSSEVRRLAASLLEGTDDKVAISALVRALDDKSANVRHAACFSLAFKSNAVALPKLIELLEHDNVGSVRRSAVYALCRVGDGSVIPPLIKTLERDEDPEVRLFAAAALGELGAKSAVPTLIKALRDAIPNVRGGAASALGQINDKSAVPHVQDALKREPDQDARVRMYFALGRAGDVGAVFELIRILREEDWAHSPVYSLLRGLGKPGVPSLIKLLNNERTDIRSFAIIYTRI